MGYQKMDKADQDRVRQAFREIAKDNDDSPKALNLVRLVKDRETGEEVLENFYIFKDDISCLYKSNKLVFITTKRGFMNKVPYPLELLEELINL